MRRSCIWVLMVGILAVTPDLVLAGPLSFLNIGSKKAATTKAKERAAASANQKTAEKIAAELRAAHLNGYDIRIEFARGTATLNGQVPDADAKSQVNQVVSRVQGVKRVVNQLKVTEPVASAPDIESVDRQLPPIKTAGAKQQPTAAKATKTLPDLKAWHRVAGQPKAQKVDNQVMAERIAATLKKAGLTGYNIEIAFEDGVATLHGAIANVQQKRKATQQVAGIPGVQMVNNELTVSGPKRQLGILKPILRQAAPASANPQAIAQQIANAVRRGGLRGSDVTIRYQNGTAILAGSVNSPEQARQAAQLALSVPGVDRVDNRLTAPGGPAVTASPYNAVPQSFATPMAMPILPVGLAAGAPNRIQQATMASVQGQPIPPAPPTFGHPGSGASHVVYNMPHLPETAWPAYASYPNYAQVSYPTQYSASAWPYIGPFYPYPQIPLGWRQVQLEWDDGYWNLNFRPRTDKWWWFLNPENWK